MKPIILLDLDQEETGIPCFECGLRSGINCSGRWPNESTRCKECLRKYMKTVCLEQIEHMTLLLRLPDVNEEERSLIKQHLKEIEQYLKEIDVSIDSTLDFVWKCIVCQKNMEIEHWSNKERTLPNIDGGTIKVDFGYGSDFDLNNGMPGNLLREYQGAICDKCFKERQKLFRLVSIEHIVNFKTITDRHIESESEKQI